MSLHKNSTGAAGGQEEEGLEDLEGHLGERFEGLVAVDDLAQLRLREAVDAVLQLKIDQFLKRVKINLPVLERGH